MKPFFRSLLRSSFILLCFAALSLVSMSGQSPHLSDAQWPTYGGDPGGQRYTASSQITKANVAQLTTAWTFHTGSIAKNRPGTRNSSFEATPILFHDLLYLTSPYDEIFAVDPTTGIQHWTYDPKLTRIFEGILTSRGVAAWSSSSPTSGACAARIFVATMDARLIAVDAGTGLPCANFGNGGSIDLSRNINLRADTAFYNSSPPTVIGNVIIVGSGIADNQRVDAEPGVVRAFDCVTGRQVWSWDPIPWANSQKLPTGAANAWGVFAADIEHGLVYIPTGSASPDFYGGMRPGDNRDANSVVALEAATGKRVWAFQVVHHDLWDYDIAAEPLLFTFRGTTPAIAITTKQGLLFVLNRLTGEPLYPITERPVPKSDVPGEPASPTQPFQDIASLSPLTIAPDTKLGATPQDDIECRKIFSTLRYEGIYTPPSLRGTLIFPGTLGGVNWGSAAIDPATGILYANTNHYPFDITLAIRKVPIKNPILRYASTLPVRPGALTAICTLTVVILLLILAMLLRRSFWPGPGTVIVCASFLFIGSVVSLYFHFRHVPPPEPVVAHFGRDYGNQFGTPYTALRNHLIAPTSKHPCAAMPWGTVSAVNLNTGKAVWQAPLGTLVPGQPTGTVNLGGDIITAGGLLFTAASEEPYLRAFDTTSGEELWKGALPVPAQATPMSYTIKGRQYVVIAAGGHGMFGTPLSDALVAYALKQD